jgi:thioesterase domain-containing protein
VQQGEQVQYLALFDPAFPQGQPLTGVDECIEAFFAIALADESNTPSDVDYALIAAQAISQPAEQVVSWAVERYLATRNDQTMSQAQLQLLLQAFIDFSLAHRDAINANPQGLVRLFVCHDRPERELYLKQWQAGVSGQIHDEIAAGSHKNMMSGDSLSAMVATIKSDSQRVNEAHFSINYNSKRKQEGSHNG